MGLPLTHLLIMHAKQKDYCEIIQQERHAKKHSIIFNFSRMYCGDSRNGLHQLKKQPGYPCSDCRACLRSNDPDRDHYNDSNNISFFGADNSPNGYDINDSTPGE